MSFRLRIFLLAWLLVAGVVALVLLVAWKSMLAHESLRLEARLCMEARRLADNPNHAAERDRIVGDLMAKLHLQTHDQLAVRVTAGTVGRDFRTVNWPLVEAATHAPWRAHAAGTQGLPGCFVAANVVGASDWYFARFEKPTGDAIVGADSAAVRNQLQQQLGGTLATVLLLCLALATLVAALIALLAIRPIRRLIRAMGETGSGSLHKRLDARHEAIEFRQLIGAYNAMLERLQSSFEQASRFSADAAHELMTPLTILRGRLEEARRQAQGEGDQRLWDELFDEVGRLVAIVRKLLLLSQADAGTLVLEREPVDLTTLLLELVDVARMAGTNDIQVRIEDGLAILADPTLLRQLLNNLLMNAIRYCATPGWIRIDARAAGEQAVLRFANAALPLPAEARSRLFERFYRSDASRARQTGGSGLGLSIAREIAKAHGGTLTLDEGPVDEVSLTLRLTRTSVLGE